MIHGEILCHYPDAAKPVARSDSPATGGADFLDSAHLVVALACLPAQIFALEAPSQLRIRMRMSIFVMQATLWA